MEVVYVVTVEDVELVQTMIRVLQISILGMIVPLVTLAVYYMLKIYKDINNR